jgi:hypothetical protein
MSESSKNGWSDAPALECDDLSSLSAGGLPPSSRVGWMDWIRRTGTVVRRAALRGAAWPTSRPSGESGVKPPHSKARRCLRYDWRSLECDDLSSLSAGGLPPSNPEGRTLGTRRTTTVTRRAALRGTAWATSRPSGESGVKPPHSKARRCLRYDWRSLECDDLASLFAGGLSPSSLAGWTDWIRRTGSVVRRAALRGAAWATGRPSGQSGDKSPHSKARRRVCR